MSRFDIGPKSGSKMLWRPNQLQLTGVRATNLASYFLSDALDACSSLKKAKRLKTKQYFPFYILHRCRGCCFLLFILFMLFMLFVWLLVLLMVICWLFFGCCWRYCE